MPSARRRTRAVAPARRPAGRRSPSTRGEPHRRHRADPDHVVSRATPARRVTLRGDAAQPRSRGAAQRRVGGGAERRVLGRCAAGRSRLVASRSRSTGRRPSVTSSAPPAAPTCCLRCSAARSGRAGPARMYGTGTCDTMNKFRVNEDMYGSPMRLAHPDVDRTQFLGARREPGLLGQHAVSPAALARALHGDRRARRARGVRQSATGRERAAGEHVFIRPDTDRSSSLPSVASRSVPAASTRARRALHVGLRRARAPRRAVDARASGSGDRRFRAMRCAILRARRRGSGAALYMATGVNQGPSGTPCSWLLE